MAVAGPGPLSSWPGWRLFALGCGFFLLGTGLETVLGDAAVGQWFTDMGWGWPLLLWQTLGAVPVGAVLMLAGGGVATWAWCWRPPADADGARPG